MGRFTESEVEDAALAWLENLGYGVLSGPEIIRSDPGYRDVVLEDSLRQALASLNPTLPPEALEDAFRKIPRVDAPSLVGRDRIVHRVLHDGLTDDRRPTPGPR